jgi:hypothetical protein
MYTKASASGSEVVGGVEHRCIADFGREEQPRTDGCKTAVAVRGACPL